MAQPGSYTPITLYYSATTTNVPLAANLAAGELAINTYDGKLFYKDSSGVVQVIGWKTTPATAGGTDQTSYAVGDLLYASTTTALSKLADIATGNALISGGVGVAPSYGKIGLTTHVSGTLPIANGGTNSTATATAGGITYGTGTAYAVTAAGTSGQAVISGGAGAPTIGTLGVAGGGTGVTASTGTGSVMLNTNPTITNYVESVVAIGNSGTTQTLALTSGTFQTVTMTGNCTFTMPTAVGGKSFTLTVNTGAGSFTATFTSVKFPGGTAPTLTTTASRFDVFTFFSDGTNWYGNAAQNFV